MLVVADQGLGETLIPMVRVPKDNMTASITRLMPLLFRRI